MRVVIYDILSMAIIPTLSTSIPFCNFCYILLWTLPRIVWWKSPYGDSKRCNINTHKKLMHCVAIFTILYGNYYPPHGEFKLIYIGKFTRRTWVNFTRQYGKNRQRCQQNGFYYAVWQLLLYFYREFPSKILSVYLSHFLYCNSHVVLFHITFYNLVRHIVYATLNVSNLILETLIAKAPKYRFLLKLGHSS